jgi:uncharacterized membrane protein YkvA (DUF1232 family)
MNGLVARTRRVMAFLADPRVPKLPRFAVLVAVAYLIWPIDLLPDFLIPVGGFLDDAALLWMTLRWLLKSGETAIASQEGAAPGPNQRPQLPR